MSATPVRATVAHQAQRRQPRPAKPEAVRETNAVSGKNIQAMGRQRLENVAGMEVRDRDACRPRPTCCREANAQAHSGRSQRRRFLHPLTGLPLRLGQKERRYRQMVAKPIVWRVPHNCLPLFRSSSAQLAPECILRLAQSNAAIRLELRKKKPPPAGSRSDPSRKNPAPPPARPSTKTRCGSEAPPRGRLAPAGNRNRGLPVGLLLTVKNKKKKNIPLSLFFSFFPFFPPPPFWVLLWVWGKGRGGGGDVVTGQIKVDGIPRFLFYLAGARRPRGGASDPHGFWIDGLAGGGAGFCARGQNRLPAGGAFLPVRGRIAGIRWASRRCTSGGQLSAGAAEQRQAVMCTRHNDRFCNHLSVPAFLLPKS